MRAQSVSGQANVYGLRSRSSVVKQSHRVISEDKTLSYLGGSGEKVNLSGQQQQQHQHLNQQSQQRPSIIYEARKLQSPQKAQQQQHSMLSPSQQAQQSPIVLNTFGQIDSVQSWKKGAAVAVAAASLNNGVGSQNPSTIFGQSRQWNIFSANGDSLQTLLPLGPVGSTNNGSSAVGSGGSGGQFWIKQSQQQQSPQQQSAKMYMAPNWPLKEEVPFNSVKYAESRFQVRGQSQLFEGLPGQQQSQQMLAWEQSPRNPAMRLQQQQLQQQMLLQSQQQQQYQLYSNQSVRMVTKEGEKSGGNKQTRGHSQSNVGGGGGGHNMMGSPQQNYASQVVQIGSALDVKYMQLSEEFKVAGAGGNAQSRDLPAMNRKQSSERSSQHRESKRINLRDSIRAEGNGSGHSGAGTGGKVSSSFEGNSFVQSQQLQQQQLLTEDGDLMGSSNVSVRPFLSPQKNTSATFESEYTAQLQQSSQRSKNEKGRVLNKRSFSAIKNVPSSLQQSAKIGQNRTTRESSQQQLMILQVKQQCTKKRYNDPMEIKKMKDRMKEVKEARMSTLIGGSSSLVSGGKSGIGGAVRGKNGIGAGQEEDDDDSDEAGSNDVSLDLDDDDDDEALKKSSSLAIGSANTSATLTPASKVHLLKSIYAGRPMTVFFPYHKSCQQPKPRDSARAVPCSEFEIKQFDLKYKINGENPYKCVVKAFEEAGFTATSEGDWNSQWSLPKKDKVRKMNPFQRLNHFPGCWNLGRKDFMWRCLNRAKRRNPKEMDFVPNTYLLCNQGDWDRFLTKKEEASKNQLWICKPADQACGRGIKVISKNSKVKRKTNRIICDYIMNPHLIDGLKYDLRLYVLVTSYDPLRIYLYEEGLTRFATEKYTTNTKEVTKRYVHLTNYSVNKFAKKFVKNTNSENDGEGSKWSHTALRAKYASMGIDVDDLYAKISDVIIKTCISAEPNMLDIHSKASEHRTNCFELYGFDVLIDSKLKPWILEVNVCPSLSSSSPLDRKIKHSLLVDTLNLIGITPYDKKHYQEQSKKNGLFHRASMRSVLVEGDEKAAGGGVGAGGMVLPSKNFSKNINDVQDLNADNCLEKLSPENWEILFETDEEYHRRGKYERIYPPVSAERREYYSQFFEFQRFNNVIIDKWMSSNVNFLEKIIKKKYHASV